MDSCEIRRMRAKIAKEESRHCSMTSSSESEARAVQQRERKGCNCYKRTRNQRIIDTRQKRTEDINTLRPNTFLRCYIPAETVQSVSLLPSSLLPRLDFDLILLVVNLIVPIVSSRSFWYDPQLLRSSDKQYRSDRNQE